MRPPKTEVEQREEKRVIVLDLLANNQISRAVNRITSHGVAAMESGDRMKVLGKYPERKAVIPVT